MAWSLEPISFQPRSLPHLISCEDLCNLQTLLFFCISAALLTVRWPVGGTVWHNPFKFFTKKLLRQQPLLVTTVIWLKTVSPWFRHASNPFRHNNELAKHSLHCERSVGVWRSILPLEPLPQTQFCHSSWVWSFEFQAFLLMLPVVGISKLIPRSMTVFAVFALIGSPWYCFNHPYVTFPSLSFPVNIQSYVWRFLAGSSAALSRCCGQYCASKPNLGPFFFSSAVSHVLLSMVRSVFVFE